MVGLRRHCGLIMVTQSGQGKDLPRRADTPDIVGETISNANSQITSIGFVVGTVSETDAPSGSPGLVDTVVSQVQTAGTTYLLGQAIDYTKYNPHFPPYFPPFFPPHFPPGFKG